ncbi:hypothetical protein ETB97_001797 [Aspergillus alliaceus]|uniref:Uncharacterized protein n=1 Tax=Petromyces alliaceus TaxID=209559 RepID=A0A5N7CIJ7_PETAA|nr:uncharacterized protein BDW43DRAFT_195983 [Aspergillus alliaceus]KAB8229066.1 hypothetical protein BDW43DRAFT_195983 [Aspergillus alliaceus]KAE8394032.1 hypothetical protein BDV23DRAFT_23785 [Aspergillus alliaceus]KAF5860263.1 hypothetical protein ETB97_001797 [Aspergillus burnettii]
MSLKRKASFSGIGSPNAAPVITVRSLMMDDSPKHLNSRTRKRYRNDRPDDQIVYENTLRRLFTAQQQQGPQLPPADEDVVENMESDVLSSEIIDSRQQTLHKFFLPARPSSFQSGLNQLKQQPDNMSHINTNFLKPHDLYVISNVNPIGSNAATPSSQESATDMEVQRDSGSDESTRRWNGGHGWL